MSHYPRQYRHGRPRRVPVSFVDDNGEELYYVTHATPPPPHHDGEIYQYNQNPLASTHQLYTTGGSSYMSPFESPPPPPPPRSREILSKAFTVAAVTLLPAAVQVVTAKARRMITKYDCESQMEIIKVTEATNRAHNQPPPDPPAWPRNNQDNIDRDGGDEINERDVNPPSQVNESTAETLNNQVASVVSRPVIDITANIRVELTSSNYSCWRANFMAVLNGFALAHHVDGRNPSPTETDPTYPSWFRQDQLILAAILGSVSLHLLPSISNAKTASEAWQILARLYATKSRARVMQLKTDLSTATMDRNKSVTEFLKSVKSKADELASILQSPVSDDDLTLYVVNGLGHAYRDIASEIRSRETPLKFKELHDLLVDHEQLFLINLESENNGIVCQLCGFRGHTAPMCRQLNNNINAASDLTNHISGMSIIHETTPRPAPTASSSSHN